MKYIILYLFLFFVIVIRSQNLVPNPSFETYSICPNSGSGGQIESAIPWTAATTNSSTDYFNVCSTLYSVPNFPGGGYQNAHTGNAFAGFYFFGAITGIPNSREYLQVQLTNPLVQNTTYYVEFFVNLHDGSFASPCNNIAANFSVVRPFTANLGDLQTLTPHIVNSGNPIISDRTNWVQISGCYTAQGGEEYLTIGNFMDASQTQTTGTTTSSYYLVDDVRVEEISGVCVLGINEFNHNYQLEVYPNPTANNLKVIINNLKDKEKLSIKLVDVIGKEVLNENYQEELDISNLEKGIYFISIIQESKTLVTKKVIKE